MDPFEIPSGPRRSSTRSIRIAPWDPSASSTGSVRIAPWVPASPPRFFEWIHSKSPLASRLDPFEKLPGPASASSTRSIRIAPWLPPASSSGSIRIAPWPPASLRMDPFELSPGTPPRCSNGSIRNPLDCPRTHRSDRSVRIPSWLWSSLDCGSIRIPPGSRPCRRINPFEFLLGSRPCSSSGSIPTPLAAPEDWIRSTPFLTIPANAARFDPF
ncbi:hypothetical protein F5Y05DRAFT_425057 [Hypoxylon sp. FL0543]|nr:hypothetical protein F5Y05DRAFT_425057 [Hypoxylon sp. FL0543]